MRRALALAILLVSGCAALPILGALGLQRLSVSVPAELPLPDTLTLKLGGAAGDAAKLGDTLLGALGQQSLEQKLGQALKESAAPLRKSAAAAFKGELQRAQLFGSIVETGGNVGISLSVSRWGLEYVAATKTYQPVLDLQASLSEPHVGVLWKGERSAAQLSADAKGVIGTIDVAALIAKPQSYQDLMGTVAQDLSQQLIADLKAHPPQIPGMP